MNPTEVKVKAFWSYVHADDDAERSRIIKLGQDIAAQYEAITAKKINLFIDRDSLAWGDNWRQQIDRSIGSVAYFIPVLTPRYFASAECRRELNLFIHEAKRFGIEELLLPILYIDVDELHQPEPDDALMALVKQYQWEVWTDLRFAPLRSERYRRAVANLAQRLVDADKLLETKEPASEQKTVTLFVDDVVQKVKADTVPVEEQKIDDDLGVLDRVANFEEDVQSWAKIAEELGLEIRAIGEIVQATSDSMLPTVDLHQRVTAFRRTASRLDPHADKLEKLGQEYVGQLYKVDDDIRATIDLIKMNSQPNPEEVKTLSEGIRTLNTSSQEGLDSIETMLTSMQPLESMSRDMRRPLVKIRKGLTAMLEARQVTSEWVKMVEEITNT